MYRWRLIPDNNSNVNDENTEKKLLIFQLSTNFKNNSLKYDSSFQFNYDEWSFDYTGILEKSFVEFPIHWMKMTENYSL